MTKPRITAFETSPDEGRGLARDMRVRWALEEVGQHYDVLLVSMKGLKQPEHLARNPFGKIPTYEEGTLTLFESGAIILYIAKHHIGLLPTDEDAKERAIVWMFAALNTVEPPIVAREEVTVFEKDKPWYDERMPLLDQRVREPLAQLSARLGEAEWLDGDFSAGDLMMVEVLLRLEGCPFLDEDPNLANYVERAKARPAFKRAFAAQKTVFEQSQKEHSDA